MNLYEHQSSWNPNMPLRNFFYIVDLYKGYVDKNHLDLYSSRQLDLPLPQSIVFYNGLREEPEQQVLKLSDSFKIKNKEGCLELYTLVLNINYGKNRELMSRCKRLLDYAKFIEEIRNYNREFPIYEAVEKAIETCIQTGVLSDFLLQHCNTIYVGMGRISPHFPDINLHIVSIFCHKSFCNNCHRIFREKIIRTFSMIHVY